MPVVGESAALEPELVEPVHGAVVAVEDVVAVALAGTEVDVLERVVQIRFKDMLPIVVQPGGGTRGGGDAHLGDAAVHCIARGVEIVLCGIPRIAPPGGAVAGAWHEGEEVSEHEGECKKVL